MIPQPELGSRWGSVCSSQCLKHLLPYSFKKSHQVEHKGAGVSFFCCCCWANAFSVLLPPKYSLSWQALECYHGKHWNASFSMRFTSTDTLSTGSPTLHNKSLVEWNSLQLDPSPSSPSSCPSWCIFVFPTSGQRGSFMTPWAELPQWALGWLLGNSAFLNYGSTVCPKYCPLMSFYEDHSKRVPTFIFYRWGVLCPYVLPNPKTPELCQELFW